MRTPSHAAPPYVRHSLTLDTRRIAFAILRGQSNRYSQPAHPPKDARLRIEEQRMSIFTKMKHAFQHFGHDVEKAAKSVAHGVEHVAKKLAHDVMNVLQDTLDITDALMHGNMKLALQDLAKLGADLEKTAADAATGSAEVALKGLGGLHLGKGFDHLVADVEKGLDTVKDAVNKGTDAGLKDLVNSAEGLVEHSLGAVKELAHGNLKGMLGEMAHVGEDALNLAADLTPEGMGTTIAASTLSALHVGNDQINGAIAGLAHGSVGKVVKAAVETGAGAGANAAAAAVNHPEAVMGGALLLTMAPSIPTGRGKKGGHTSTTSHLSDPGKPNKSEKPESKDDKKDDKKADDKKADGKEEKKKDKKDEKDGKDNDNGGGNAPKIFIPPAKNDAFTRNVKRL
jgi:hypothetical protein